MQLYTPLFLAWARKLGLQAQDAADLVQELLAKLLRELPKFQYDPAKKNFRGWLRTVCFNLCRDWQRARAARGGVGSDAGLSSVMGADDGLHDFWQQEHDAFLVRQALRVFTELEGEFEPHTLTACREVVLRERAPEDVAQELGVAVNVVYIAKLRVLRRLRQELAEFLE